MASKFTPGILYVTMQPKDGLPDTQFHDWYQNEHGPNRLRLPFCNNGFRYRATDLNSQPGSKEQPEWMAVYDFDELEWLTREAYTKLRSAPVQSQRERDTMKQIFVDRRSYDLLREWKADDFRDLQKVDNEGEKNVMIAVSFELQDGEGNEAELQRWYEEEHVSMLQKVPGWRRSRRFETSYLDLESGYKTTKEFLALHEYAPENGLGGEALKAATTTKWCEKIYADVVKNRKRRIYDLYYTFGAAPRDLNSLESKDTVAAEFTQGATKTHPAHITGDKSSVIESFITTPDGVQLPYRLEGSPSPIAPVLILSNSILVDYTIWDAFVAHFLRLTNNTYRIIRYNTRGRYPLPSSSISPITLSTLTDDVLTILSTLRITRASIVGVSLGGATALNAALEHPHLISAFVACDTNAFAPPSNIAAWNERVAMCEKEGATSTSPSLSPTSEPIPIVGANLAEATARRWFPASSYADASLAHELERVKQLVAGNSLQGFKESVHALHAYDIRAKMAGFTGKGAFLAGGEDGVLPKTMKEQMAEKLGEGGKELKVIQGAGHLPMVEKGEEVAGFVKEFLEGSK